MQSKMLLRPESYIGFKHINGPHRWDALAKARFAATWYRKERKHGLTLEKIAQRLGDRHDTVVRLVNGIFVLDQAEEKRFTPSMIDIREENSRSRISTQH